MQVKRLVILSLTTCCLSALASNFESLNTEMDTRQLPELMTSDSVGRCFVPQCSTSGVNGLMSKFTRERMNEKSDNFVQVVASDMGKLTFYTSTMSGPEGSMKRGSLMRRTRATPCGRKGLDEVTAWMTLSATCA